VQTIRRHGFYAHHKIRTIYAMVLCAAGKWKQYKCKCKRKKGKHSHLLKGIQRGDKWPLPIMPIDLTKFVQTSINIYIKSSQLTTFLNEYVSLMKCECSVRHQLYCECIDNNSPLFRFDPYFCTITGTLRISLRNSNQDVAANKLNLKANPFFHLELTQRDLAEIQNPLVGSLNQSIMSVDDNLTKAYILHLHKELICGNETQIKNAASLQGVFILGSKNKITKIIKTCGMCKFLDTKTLSVPLSQLPAARVNLSIAYTFISFDFLGSFNVKVKSKPSLNLTTNEDF